MTPADALKLKPGDRVLLPAEGEGEPTVATVRRVSVTVLVDDGAVEHYRSPENIDKAR